MLAGTMGDEEDTSKEQRKGRMLREATAAQRLLMLRLRENKYPILPIVFSFACASGTLVFPWRRHMESEIGICPGGVLSLETLVNLKPASQPKRAESFLPRGKTVGDRSGPCPWQDGSTAPVHKVNINFVEPIC